MERSFLTEAFKSLSVLNEEDFNLNDTEDVEEMKDFADDSDSEEFIDVIDPSAENEEELEDSYVGKVICDCMTCHSKIYKLPTDIIKDEETGLVNVGEECPYCFDSTGYKVIGEVAAYSPEAKEADADVEDDLGLDSDAEVKPEEPVEEPAEEEPVEDDDDLDESLNEELENVEVKTEDGAVEITKEPGKTTIEIKEETEALEDVPELEEPIENPVETPAAEGEEIVPLSPETQDLIDSTSDEVSGETAEIVDDEIEPLPTDDEDVDYDLEDFDEESFDGLGESYLKRVYENVDSFKTTCVKQRDNKLMLEGVIKFNSGKQKKTSFVFEAAEATSTGKVKFLGENTQISRGKKSFALRGNISDKKFISESFTYNYMTKDANDKSVRLYGTVKRNK